MTLLFLAVIALAVVFGIRVTLAAIGAAYRFGAYDAQHMVDIAAVDRDKAVNDAAANAIEGESKEWVL